jgi:glycosyltransferase involved in cell wall biosynthesis
VNPGGGAGSSSVPFPAKSVTLVSHVRTTGPLHALEHYVVPRAASVLVIEHQLVHSVPAYSRYRFYESGVLRTSGERAVRLPEVVRFASDAILTLVWTHRIQRDPDAFIGVGALNAFVGLVLRALGLARRCVFWVIDYSPQRFDNRVLDAAFHMIDSAAALRCDETWNLAPRIEEMHLSKRYARLVRRRANVQKIVPIGVDPINLIETVRHPRRLVFVGHVLEKQGLQLAVEAMPSLAKRFPDIELVVVGDGPYLDAIRRLVGDLGIDAAVTFTGFVESEHDVQAYLAAASIGLATYLPTPGTFTFYTDPGKIKLYLAAGLPICVTNVPAIARDLEQRGCAVVVEPTAASVAEHVADLLGNQQDLEQKRIECLAYAEEITWDRVFDKAFDVTVNP